MITGFFKTPSERMENVVINTTLLTQIGTFLLKVAGISTLSWTQTFIPLMVLVGIVSAMIIMAKTYRYYLQLRDTLDLIKFQRASKKASKAE